MPTLCSVVLLALGLSTVAAEVVHYPPGPTNNNLTLAVNGTGTNGIYNASFVDDSLYGLYNWCNMPHVRPTEYIRPTKDFKLKYVELIHRHHKRTPYASNVFPNEESTWSCSENGALPVQYAATASGNTSNPVIVSWEASKDLNNPFTNLAGSKFGNSTCQFPQITDQGLADSLQHGVDLRGVYHDLLRFLPSEGSDRMSFRVSNNVITSQVLGSLLKGLYPKMTKFNALVQSEDYDSLEPTYSCPTADRILTEYKGNNQNWTEHLQRSRALFGRLDDVSGVDPEDSGWHASFDHYFDNFSAKQCHDKRLPCSLDNSSDCITQAGANAVYRLGQFEYGYNFRNAPDSARWATLHYGAYLLELAANLRTAMEGRPGAMLYRHNVAHDGSMSSLLGLLQIETMVWPGMGSEVVFELWSRGSKEYLRVLWSGLPMKTSTPLGTLDMIPVGDFLAYLAGSIPRDLVAACQG